MEHVVVLSGLVIALTALISFLSSGLKSSLGVAAGALEAGDAPPARAAAHLPTAQDTPAAASGWPIGLAVGGLMLFGFAIWKTTRRRKTALLPAAPNAASEPQDSLAGFNSESLFLKRRQIYGAISQHWGVALCGRIQVQQLMTHGPLAVSPNTSRNELESIFQTTQIHHLLVTDGDRLVGILSDHDVETRRGDDAQALMTPRPVTIETTALADQAVTIMLTRRFACLPIVENTRVRGILTTTDLIMAFQCALRALENVARELGVESDPPPESPASERRGNDSGEAARLATASG